eukprot:12176645-Alexandrium_andersonii.AAC.1
MLQGSIPRTRSPRLSSLQPAGWSRPADRGLSTSGQRRPRRSWRSAWTSTSAPSARARSASRPRTTA